MNDYNYILKQIYQDIQPLLGKGRVADYIPALANADRNKFAMAVRLLDGTQFSIGNIDETFSIQSVSKVLSLTTVIAENDEFLSTRCGKEPSGTPFNSLVQLEYESGIPRNPFINAGALVTSDQMYTNLNNPKKDFLRFVRDLSGNRELEYNEKIARSEFKAGFRNAALINLMKDFNNIENCIDGVLDTYYHQCSIEMNCANLCDTFSFLANYGVNPINNKKVISRSVAKRINAIMLTCGTYDAVGDVAYRIGLPAKSGVGGGIIAIVPGLLTVSVWSPGLDEKGNSLAGIKALELFTTYADNSIF
ncbi:MAG: glutaminase [Ichthyobacteriaceae bacterium]|nr:glutaminase [Ichthyobacteriaceae bacterium]